MRERFRVGIMISVFVVLAALICAGVLLSASSEPKLERIAISSLTGIEIRNPEIALQYGITGYLEITLPSDTPSSLSVDRGGEINITILLHFVSYTSEATEAQVNIDPKNPWGLRIEQGDVIFNDLVSYNPSGDIPIKAGETMPVTMSFHIPANFPTGIEAIPLCAMGISANFPILDGLGGIQNGVAIH